MNLNKKYLFLLFLAVSFLIVMKPMISNSLQSDSKTLIESELDLEKSNDKKVADFFDDYFILQTVEDIRFWQPSTRIMGYLGQKTSSFLFKIHTPPPDNSLC